jgi:hypothetical protein
MPSGRVKFFNTDRGYGFIAPDGGGSDVFVHVHDVEAAGMSRPIGRIRGRPRAGWPLKGRQSSLARALEMPHSRRKLLANAAIPASRVQRKRNRKAVRDDRWNAVPISNYRRLDE